MSQSDATRTPGPATHVDDARRPLPDRDDRRPGVAADAANRSSGSANRNVNDASRDEAPRSKADRTGTGDEPAFRVREMPAANRAPLMIGPDQPVGEAVHLMMEYDYSRLPVGNGPRGVKGMISWKHLARKLVVQQERPCDKVAHCMQRTVRSVHDHDGLFEAIDAVQKYGYVLVRNGRDEVCGILTAYDIADRFDSLAKPFMLIEEIEKHLRKLVGELPLDILRSARRPGQTGPQIDGVGDLTFSEYVTLLSDDANWKALRINLDRKRLAESVDRTRVIRNTVMHFSPKGIDDDAMDHLRRFAGLLHGLDRARRA